MHTHGDFYLKVLVFVYTKRLKREISIHVHSEIISTKT